MNDNKLRVYLQKNILNDLSIIEIKEIIKLQDIIETDNLYYNSKRKKIYNSTEYSLPIVF